MSQENVDLHREVVAAINTRQISDEIAEQMLAPDAREALSALPQLQEIHGKQRQFDR